MIKFFRLSKLHFALENQMSCGLLIVIGMLEIAACGKNRNLKHD